MNRGSEWMQKKGTCWVDEGKAEKGNRTLDWLLNLENNLPKIEEDEIEKRKIANKRGF